MIFFAKSADENGKQTTNQEHLQTTALLAKAFGTEIQMPMTAWISGLLHDFGKYSDLFQSVLKGTASHIDHAVCAAVFLYACVLQKKPSYRPVAAVTAAHHSFLRSFDSIMPELSELLHGKGTGICLTGKRAALFGPEEYAAAQNYFLKDFPTFQFVKLEKHPDDSALERSFYKPVATGFSCTHVSGRCMCRNV